MRTAWAGTGRGETDMARPKIACIGECTSSAFGMLCVNPRKNRGIPGSVYGISSALPVTSLSCASSNQASDRKPTRHAPSRAGRVRTCQTSRIATGAANATAS